MGTMPTSTTATTTRATTTESRRRGLPSAVRAIALAVGAVLVLAACTSGEDADRLAYADDSSETAGATGAGDPVRDAAADLAEALDELGTGYRFEADLQTAGGGQVSIDGYRVGEALTFQLTVSDLTIETVARDGTLWTRVLGDDEWSTDPWTTGSDPMAPLREPVEVWATGANGDMVAVYQAASLGLGVDDTVDVNVTAADGEVRFATTSDRMTMVSVLRADDSLPAIVAPA